MSLSTPLETPERLRTGASPRTGTVRPEEAEVSVRPRFAWLLLLALAVIILQSTLLRSLSFRGAQPSLLTVALVWAGLRAGTTSAGWLGLICGLIEDALGGGGTNVLGTTLTGYLAGLLSMRFFADSLPVFVSAVAVATWLRGGIAFLVLEAGMGERGIFHRMSHELAWQTVLNCLLAIVVLLALRIVSHLPRRSVA